MTDWINQSIASLNPYQPGKPIDELTRELGITDIIKLASNENPRGPGPMVRECVVRAAEELSRYPDGSGYLLKAALAEHLDVEVNRLTLGNGSNDVLELAAKVTLEAGLEGVMSEHGFVVYYLAITGCSAKLVRVPAKNYGHDLEGYLDAITDATRIVFIANPNNPTGTWVTEADLVDFLERLPERIWVVLDEAYYEYVEAQGYPNGVRLVDRYPNLIVTRTFSKIHGLASLRIGYSVSSPLAADLMNRARQPFNVNSLALAAAQGALADQQFVTTSRTLNREGMGVITAGLAKLGLEYIPSVGNFVCFDVGQASTPVYERLLSEGVIVRPVAEYGLPTHLRVSVGLPEENQRFLQTLERVLARA